MGEDEEFALVLESPAERSTCIFGGGVGGVFLLGGHGG